MNTMTRDFSAVKRLKIGSNTFQDFNALIEIGDQNPLVISGGEVPVVTLLISMNGNWVPIVEGNKSNSPAVGVNIDRHNRSIKIVLMGNPLLIARCLSEDDIEFTQLDIRPLGLNIFLEGDTFIVGNMKFSRNTFSGVGTVFKLD